MYMVQFSWRWSFPVPPSLCSMDSVMALLDIWPKTNRKKYFSTQPVIELRSSLLQDVSDVKAEMQIGLIWRIRAIENKLWHRAATNTCLLGISAVVSRTLCVPCFLAGASADSHGQTLATGMNWPLVWPKYLKIFILIAVPSDIWS